MTTQEDTKLVILLPTARLWMVRNEIFKVAGFGQYTLSTRLFTIPKPDPTAQTDVVTLPGQRWYSTGRDGVWRCWWVYRPRLAEVADGHIDGVTEDWIINQLRRTVGFRPLRPEPKLVRKIIV